MLYLGTPQALSPPAATAPLRQLGTPIPNPRAGICWVNGMNYPDPAPRYAQTTDVGATWTRWVFKWSEIEPNGDGHFNWATVDAVVVGDVANDLRINAILADGYGTIPSTYQATAPNYIIGLTEPVFADGTNTPSASGQPAKSINPNNPWARFVYEAVTRYKDSIQYWEIWNEPDGNGAWTPSGLSGAIDREPYQRSYLRLLQVAHAAAKNAVNPSGQEAYILFGGQMYWEYTMWFSETVGILLDPSKGFPNAPTQNYYFDILPWHSYAHPVDTYNVTQSYFQPQLARLGGKEIWLNESGVMVNDDPRYTIPANTMLSATEAEQAAYVIQAHAYTLAASAPRHFHHQLYDDGGDPGATTLFGLVRNPPAYAFYPHDGAPRAAYRAYQVAAHYLRAAVLAAEWTPNTTANGYEEVPFYRETTQEWVRVLWAVGGTPVTAQIAPRGTPQATLVNQAGTPAAITPDGGYYRIALEGATNTNHVDETAVPYMIGGAPQILVEQGAAVVATVTPPPSPTITPAATTIITFTTAPASPPDVAYNAQTGEWVVVYALEDRIEGVFECKFTLCMVGAETAGLAIWRLVNATRST